MWQKIGGQIWTTNPTTCIFFGYSEDEFGYRLWNLLDKKVVRSHDIVFMEDKTIVDWKQQKPMSFSQLTIVMESPNIDPSSTQAADDRI